MPARKRFDERPSQEEPEVDIRTERVQIDVGGSPMGAYVARPDDAETRAAVIVFMEVFGVNSHIRDVTERVAREGYVAIAPDFFHRTAPGLELGYGEKDMEQGIGNLMKLDANGMIADARATIQYLKSRPDVNGDRIGCMGFCIGGHMTYLTACETEVKAAASYYGGGIAVDPAPGGAPATVTRTPKIQGRIACYFGGQDAMIPMDQIDQIRKALQDAGVRHDVHVYPEADHGFHCDQRATYHEPSARDAWAKTLELFAAELK
jgi:carboxymethylenebutenolidase